MTAETITSLLIGVGLSAACGFRVFVPLLIVGIAAHTGNLSLASGFEWLGSTPALIAFGLATALEVAAYYIPWVDNLLDSIAGPAAVLAGTLVTASLVTDISPFFKWTLAAIAGGGMAGMVKGTAAITRGASTVSTGGLANPVLATAELGGSVTTSILAIVFPILAVVLVFALLYLTVKRLFRKPVSSDEPTAS